MKKRREPTRKRNRNKDPVGLGKGHVPIRTCLSCGRKRSRKSMIRMALDGDGKILMDAEGTLPGRGAYVCRERECIDGLVQGGRITRGFRKKGKVQANPEALRGLREKLTELVFH